ncbi:MAG TPA: hypothetical protein VI248_12625 [Kineosporiaceae bacterium]
MASATTAGVFAFCGAPVVAGILLQGDVLPFIVTHVSTHPLWAVALLGWLVPGTIVNLGVVGTLVSPQRRRLRGYCVLAAIIPLPIALFLLFSCFTKYHFLAPTSFEKAGRTLVGLAWQGKFLAGGVMPVLGFFTMAGWSWLRLRWRGQRVALREVPGSWRPGTGRFAWIFHGCDRDGPLVGGARV